MTALLGFAKKLYSSVDSLLFSGYRQCRVQEETRRNEFLAKHDKWCAALSKQKTFAPSLFPQPTIAEKNQFFI